MFVSIITGEVLTKFMHWLNGISKTEGFRFIAHGGHGLDAKILSQKFEKYVGGAADSIIERIVYGDSVKAFQKFLPNWKPRDLDSLVHKCYQVSRLEKNVFSIKILLAKHCK